MAKELEKTIKVNDDEYNINAKKAEQVENSLLIKRIPVTNIDGSAVTIAEFDGSAQQDITIVTADEGGRFKKRITVPSFSESTWKADGETVLNYNDIKNTVLTELKNNTVLYEWDGNTLAGGGTTGTIKSVSIVTGNDENVSSFARKNYSSKQFSVYIYVAENTGNIYFGKSSSTEVIGVKVSAENAVTADSANHLARSCKFSVDLTTDNEVAFNGTDDAPLGVTGMLPLSNGGLGGDISIQSSQAAKTAEYYINGSIGESTAQVTDNTWMLFRHNSPSLTAGQYCRKQASMFWNYIAGKIRTIFGFTSSNVLSASNGGTGQTNLDNVTVGTSKKIQSTLRTPSGYRTLNTTLTINTVAPNSADGNEGDIWITYSNS